MAKMVTSLFKTREAAALAADRLVDAGFSRNDISILLSEEVRGREFGIKESSKAPEGAATGAAVGGVLGAIAAGLVAVGVIAVPGIGLVAAGPILASLAGAGAGGTVGGLIGAMAGMGIPEHEAKLYSQEIGRGGILVGVYAHEDRDSMARSIFKEAGGTHVS